MELSSLLLRPDVLAMFSKAAQADMTQKLFIISICWKVMGKKIGKHFANMEKAVTSTAEEVRALKVAVQADFAAQSARLTVLEDGMIHVQQRVKSLEDK